MARYRYRGCCMMLLLLFIAGCATKPPIETGNFLASDLVEIIQLDSTIHLDIRNATSNNLTGKPVYSEARAFLQRPAADALVRVNQKLKTSGYGLLVFDGYRPWSVTKLFWNRTSKANKKFVADPRKGSRHNRGCAVDLTLYDLKTGKEVSMPGAYDEMSERSYPNYTGGTEEQRRLRDMLRTAMEAEEYTVFEFEWWHFDYKNWRAYHIENIPFSSIK